MNRASHPSRRVVHLGAVQETLLIPLYGRAVESRKPDGLLTDPRAEEMVESLDYDFSRFEGVPSLVGATLRTLLFDHWVRDFLQQHPDGTVVELGTGLNTRYERVGNGKAHWFDVDLPDVIELRRAFFADEERRRMVAASVLDEVWVPLVQQAPGPYFFAAEAVLPYLTEPGVRQVLHRLTSSFPGSLLALDTTGPGMVDTQDSHDALGKVTARMQWSCADPAELQQWKSGLRLMESYLLTALPKAVNKQLPEAYREMLRAAEAQRLPQLEDYRLSLVRLGDR
jgi:O-methyltransferase involved in polyketide biosynthesis